MKNLGFSTPILLVAFNRPDTTARVFSEIREVKPSHLYIAADGPREKRPEDAIRCKEVRDIVSRVDWPCEVKTLFREKNLGCKYGVSSAIDWFFSQVEKGIILEDDDLPAQSFFYYCAELLEKYRDNPRIMHISGNNFQQDNKKFHADGDYYFSSTPHIWGWATWRRAWKFYDVEAKQWPKMKERGRLRSMFTDKAVQFFWANLFQRYYDKKINSYDGQWALACMEQGGLSITPRVNLVTNIGFGGDATHTTSDQAHMFANLSTEPLPTPLTHPHDIAINKNADAYTFKYVFEINRDLSQKIKWFFKSHCTKPYLWAKRVFYRLAFHRATADDASLLVF